MAPHWTGLLIIGLLVLVLFGGRGKISALMGDMAKGITAFRKGLKDEDETSSDTPSSQISEDGSAQESTREDERSSS